MTNKLIKEIPKALLISFIIFLVLLFIDFLVGGLKFDNPSELGYSIGMRFFYSIIYSMSLYLVNAILFIKLDDIFGENRFTPKHLIIGFVFSFFLH